MDSLRKRFARVFPNLVHTESARSRRLEEALRTRLARPQAYANRARGTLAVEARDGESLTLHLFPNKPPSIFRGVSPRPTAIVRGDEETLHAILSGRTPGLHAFFDGKIEVRGNVGLALKLDLFFPPPDLPPDAPRPGICHAAGIETFYLEAGPRDAPVVVLLHGLGATNVSMLPLMISLAHHHRVIAPDSPGFGETGKPLISPYHFAFFSRWLDAFLDGVHARKAHLVGNSMGGRISLEMAMRFPERVDRLVLLAPSMAWRSYRELAPLVRLLRPEMALLPLPVLRMQTMVVLHTLFANPLRVRESWLDAAADEFEHAFRSPRGRVAFFASARSIYLEDPHGQRGFWDRLRKVKAPALFVWGDRDWLVPKEFARHASDAMPHAHSVVLADCGHVPQYEQSARTSELVRHFFASDGDERESGQRR